MPFIVGERESLLSISGKAHCASAKRRRALCIDRGGTTVHVRPSQAPTPRKSRAFSAFVDIV
eukprot:3937098-Amphidinium_carterae.2